MSEVYIDPYEAESHGIKYEDYQLIMNNQNLDPYFCEDHGISYDDWNTLKRLNRRD